MKAAPTPTNEGNRLEALHTYRVLDTPREESFDRVIRLVCRIFSAPIGTITLVDQDRQWFKSSFGVDACETERDISFCGHVVYQGEPLIVLDTYEDERFVDNPLVVGPPYIRFYAGVPLTTHDGFHIGVLCVQDQQPRPQGFSAEDIATLSEIAAMTIDELDLRKAKKQVENEQEVARRVIHYAARSEVLSIDGVQHYYRPAERLSGDLLLAGQRPEEDTYLFLLGDFTGHGIGAAVGVPALAGKFNDLLEQRVESDRILGLLTQHLYYNLPPEMFLTAALIEFRLHNESPHLAIWNAGLPSLLLFTKEQGFTHFPSEGVPLGILPTSEKQSAGIKRLLPSTKSCLYAFSDGVIETRLANNSMLGLAGLEKLIQDNPGVNGFERIRQFVEEAQQINRRNADDLTLLQLDLEMLTKHLSD